MTDRTTREKKRGLVDAVGQRLTQALQADRVDIKDVTHRHANHAQADGRAHFQVRVVSHCFEGKAPLTRHRLIYDALDDLMKTDIHSLAITALTPDQDPEFSDSPPN